MEEASMRNNHEFGEAVCPGLHRRPDDFLDERLGSTTDRERAQKSLNIDTHEMAKHPAVANGDGDLGLRYSAA